MTEQSPSTMKKPLPIAAQAIMIAATNGNFNVVNDPVYKQCIAAALRVVAGQLKNTHVVADCNEFERGFKEAHILYRTQLLDIAAELEESND